MNYLNPEMDEKEIASLSVLGLAYVGDCVYELLVRSWLTTTGWKGARDFHRAAVSIVNARAQAKAVEKLLPILTPEELSVYKRGRNAKVNSVPQKATVAEYHAATGFEALLGWLYLNKRTDRINELFSATLPENEQIVNRVDKNGHIAEA